MILPEPSVSYLIHQKETAKNENQAMEVDLSLYLNSFLPQFQFLGFLAGRPILITPASQDRTFLGSDCVTFGFSQWEVQFCWWNSRFPT